MTAKKTLLLAQILITLMMAFCMSGIMGAIAMGLTGEWLRVWQKQFLIAWPIAFCLTLVSSRLGFHFAHKLTGARKAERAGPTAPGA